MTDSSFFQSYTAMFVGYERAFARFMDAAAGDDSTEAFIPLFEALNWAVALDERTKTSWAPDGEILGWAWRARIPQAELMAGVRFARNRIHHQWADALRLDRTGFQFPIAFPLRAAEWVWREVNGLPPGRQDVAGEAVYRDGLQGRAARAALRELADAFGHLRDLLEPRNLARNRSLEPGDAGDLT
jgi:hypothetical protein